MTELSINREVPVTKPQYVRIVTKVVINKSIKAHSRLVPPYSLFSAPRHARGPHLKKMFAGFTTLLLALGSLLVASPAYALTVPGSPAGVTATAGNGQASVSWTAPASDGGSEITGYTVTSTPGGLTATTKGQTTDKVKGLINGTAYTFTVTATNAAGDSLASVASAEVTPSKGPTPTPATVPGSPEGVSATAGNGQASVSWTAPASDGGSVITGYTVTSTPGGLTATTAGTSASVTGLTNGTAYTFTVTAANAIGTSVASTASTTVTPATVPGGPTSVSATPGDTQASLSWTAPASNGGSAITGYTVTSTPGGLTATTAGTSASVTGLTNGTAYTFTVTATNTAGTSAASAASATVTPTAPTPAKTTPTAPAETILPAPAPPAPTPAKTTPTAPAKTILPAPAPPAPTPAKTTPTAPPIFLQSLPPVGGATIMIGGVPTTSEVTANRRKGTITLSVGNVEINVSPKSPAGASLALATDGTAILNAGGDIAWSGRGYAPGSALNFYLLSGSTATFLGILDVFDDGTFAGSIPIPGVLAPGPYTLQVNGLTNNTRQRAVDTRVISISILARVIGPNAGRTAGRTVAYFDAFSAKLTKSAKRQLDTVVKRLPTKSNNLVRIAGFVGPGGSIGHVNALSKARAESVARYLRSEGVRGKYILKVGGNASPNTPSARRANVLVIPNRGT